MRILFLFLALTIPATASAQYKQGMIWVNGAWVERTPQAALDALLAAEGATYALAIDVLRQTIGKHSAAELDAFADELGRLFREGSRAESHRANVALKLSAMEDYPKGVPYTRAKDIFIEAYESLVSVDFERAHSALSSILRMGGEDFVWQVFNSSEPPEKPCWNAGLGVPVPRGMQLPPAPPKEQWCPYKKSTWCAAGYMLVLYGENKPDPEKVVPVCFSAIKRNGEWVKVIF